jgi:hypothetical protein
MKQIVFTFDTTGSMYPALTQTRRSIVETVRRLFREIPDLEIGIIAHGDYCDRNSTYVTKHLNLTTNERAIVDFVNGVGATGGGDAEECYELVLHEARRDMTWKAGATKVVVLIGDDVPHAPYNSQNTKHIDWRNELKLMLEADIKVYGVQALRRSHAAAFYDEIAKTTGGFHLNLDQFAHVQELILAVCYKQQSDSALAAFEDEVNRTGRMNRSLDEMFAKLYGKSAAKVARRSVAFAPTSLRSVHPARFQMLYVPRDRTIMDFVEDNGLAFQKGRGFYELTKTVRVQKRKEIILQDKKSGDFFTGDAARDMLGLPHGEDAKLKPVDLDKYRVFIQSTSVNRKLLGETNFLYEVDSSLR